VIGEAQTINMLLTSAPPDVATYARWTSNPEPVYIQGLSAEKMRIGVGEATDMVLSEKIKELQEQINGPGLPLEAAIQDLAKRVGVLLVRRVAFSKFGH
jgi:hypothetical protein